MSNRPNKHRNKGRSGASNKSGSNQKIFSYFHKNKDKEDEPDLNENGGYFGANPTTPTSPIRPIPNFTSFRAYSPIQKRDMNGSAGGQMETTFPATPDGPPPPVPISEPPDLIQERVVLRPKKVIQIGRPQESAPVPPTASPRILNKNPPIIRSKSDEDLGSLKRNAQKGQVAAANAKLHSETNGRVNGDVSRHDDSHDHISYADEDAVVDGEEDPSRRNSTGGSQSPHPLSFGSRSPGTQSVASINSTATVISTTGIVHGDLLREPRKQSLGDVLKQIENACRGILRHSDFTKEDPVSDMQYLVYQSRYNSDPSIKRRMIMKVVDCGLIEIFMRVFKSVTASDYLGTSEVEKDDSASANQNGATSQNKAASNSSLGSDKTGSYGSGKSDKSDEPKSEPTESESKVYDKVYKPSASMKNLKAVITVMYNATEKSNQLCEDCIKRGVVGLLINSLNNPHFSSAELAKDQHRVHIIKGYLGILNNIIRFHNDARDVFREAGAVAILQQYLKCSLLMIKTKTIMLLSYIINETENDIINSSDKNIGFLVKMLQSAVETDAHYSKKYGYWAVEVTAGLNRLACCETNKDRIVKKGALPLYAKLLNTNCSEEENLVASKGLWILAFHPEVKKAIHQETECVQGLHNLEQNSQREEIRKTASGALWVINDQNAPNVPVGPGSSSGKEAPSRSDHILISYQWASKHVVQRLRERLRGAGYRVFNETDTANACTNIMDSMATSVGNAAVVLVCMSQKYKDSPSCRTEAEYSYKKKKLIIPLRIQPKYNPDGWLAALTGNRYFFDFSRSDNIEMMFPNLVKELGTRAKEGAENANSVRHTVMVHASSLANKSTQSLSADYHMTMSLWKPDEVIQWLKKYELNSVSHTFKNINGELLLQMCRMRREAPETFYQSLKSDLRLDFVSILRLTKALDSIGI